MYLLLLALLPLDVVVPQAPGAPPLQLVATRADGWLMAQLINRSERPVSLSLGFCREPNRFLYLVGENASRFGMPIPCLDRQPSIVTLPPGGRATYLGEAPATATSVRYRGERDGVDVWTGTLTAPIVATRPQLNVRVARKGDGIAVEHRNVSGAPLSIYARSGCLAPDLYELEDDLFRQRPCDEIPRLRVLQPGESFTTVDARRGSRPGICFVHGPDVANDVLQQARTVTPFLGRACAPPHSMPGGK